MRCARADSAIHRRLVKRGSRGQRRSQLGPVAGLVGIEAGVVSLFLRWIGAFQCIWSAATRWTLSERRYLGYWPLDPVRVVLGRRPLKHDGMKSLICPKKMISTKDVETHFYNSKRSSKWTGWCGIRLASSKRTVGIYSHESGCVAGIIDRLTTRNRECSIGESPVRHPNYSSVRIFESHKINPTGEFDIVHVEKALVLHFEQVR
jgi:hypothetical protein